MADSKPSAAEVAAMSLRDFCRADLIVIVRSEEHGRLIFASDNVPAQKLGQYGLPIYRGEELLKIAKMKPHEIALLHQVKKVFNGQIESVEQRS